MENKVMACISLGLVDMQIVKENGEIIKKSVTLQNFIELISDSARENKFRLGSLPEGYYDAKIGSLEDNTYSCGVIVKGCRFIARYYEETMQVPYPNLFFWFDVVNGNVTKSKCFSLMDDDVNDETKLYHFPYANVYADGRICWGENKLPKVTKIQDIDNLVALFFGAPYNDDLFTAKEKLCNTGTIGLYDLFKMLEKEKKFPDKYLKDTNLSIKDVL